MESSYLHNCDNCNERCNHCLLTQALKSNYTNLMMDTKFALVIHGDTPSTSRLYDAISSGALPIIISANLYEQGLPFLKKVPWFDFCFFISQFEATEEIIRQILDIIENVDESVLKYKFETMRKYVRDVSWTHPESRIVKNVVTDAHETCRI